MCDADTEQKHKVVNKSGPQAIVSLSVVCPSSMFGCYIERDLRPGSFGFDVSCLQHHMSSVEQGRRGRRRSAKDSETEENGESSGTGLYNGKMTGYYGEETRNAVARWQVSERLK